jgi:membrane associated rhomboid family serine protease
LLFPLGFGNWPRVFPFAIVFIVAVCMAWSFQYFPHLNSFEKKFRTSIEKFEVDNLETLKVIFRDSCKAKFKAEKECATASEGMRAASFNLPASITREMFSSLGTEKYTNLIQYLTKFYENKPKSWPKEARKHEMYEAYVKEYAELDNSRKVLSKEFDMNNYDNKSFFGTLRASFTHGDYLHLFGNLLFLVIFGVWVNQRMGSAWTMGVFLLGSFIGLYSQILANPDGYVLGASAGISALMGSFFAFFYAAEFHFLFTFGFMYFKRLAIPLYWVFPAFYVAADFTALLGRESTGVAHLAHLVGFVVGVALGFLHKKLYPVPKGQLFAPESELLTQLKQASNPSAVWTHYREIMKWNLQNNEATEQFLAKSAILGVNFKDQKEFKICSNYISQYLLRCFRKSEVSSIINSLENFPPQFSLKEIVKDVPLRQILQIADFSASKSYFHAALGLYQSAFPKLNHPKQIEAVNNSISLILQKQHADQLKVSGG